jgi:hypothetical protein
MEKDEKIKVKLEKYLPFSEGKVLKITLMYKGEV